MAGHSDLSKDVDIDIAGLFADIWKKKWLILIASLLVGGLTFFILSSIAPRYETTAQLIIEPRESQFTQVNSQDRSSNSSEFDTAAVLSQVQIILSDSIALRTIKKLDLANSEEFSGSGDPSLVNDIMVLAGLKKSAPVLSPDEQKVRDAERILKEFKERLKAYSIENSRVIEIYFWANDPKLAKLVANEVAEQYLKIQQESKLQTDASATDFLEPEIEKMRKRVREAEAKVAEYRSSSDILLGNNNSLLATQQLSEVSTELSRVRAQRSAEKAKVETIRATINGGGSLEMVPEVLASPLIQNLRESQVRLRAQISELSVTLLPSHPRLQSLRSQLNDFESQIRREARSILQSLENNLDILKSQESSLSAELTRLKAESARAGEAEVELRALERDALSERELLQSYMTKFREAAGRQNSQYIPVNARIISAAHTPTDSFFPKTIPYTLVATIVTAVLGMVGVLMISLLTGSALKSVNTVAQPYREEEAIAVNYNQAPQVPPQPFDPAAYQPVTQNKVEPKPAAEQEIVATDVAKVAASVAASENKKVEQQEVIQQKSEIEEREVLKQADIERLARQKAEEKLAEEARKVEQQTVQTKPQSIPQPQATIPTPVPPSIQVNQRVEKKRPASSESMINLELVTQGLMGMGQTRIAMLSPGGDDGSVATWLLARKLAKKSKNVVVMDMTGSGVTSEHMLGTASARGVGDFLAGDVDLNDIIRQDRHSPAHVIGVGNFASQEAGLTRDRLMTLIDVLSESYDFVIVDCGYADAHGLSQFADAETVVLVSAIGTDKAKLIEQELLEIGYPETITICPTADETREAMALVA